MCRVLEISSSGYYGFLLRTGVNIQPVALLTRIKEIHRQSRGTYGSRRIMCQLRKDGLAIGRYRVRRLMRLGGIAVKLRRRYKATTKSTHNYAVTANLVAGCFQTARPNLIWVSDITYIKTSEGWLYLAVVMDLYSRKIVGWALDRYMAVALVKRALIMAIGRRRPAAGLIHHSDRGSQYACHEYRQLLATHNMISSMSRSGCCLDNAVAERFFGTLKTECHATWWNLPAEIVRRDIVDYIEMFYNSQRLHSFNGYLSPNDFEKSEMTLV
jgi:putative transposase